MDKMEATVQNTLAPHLQRTAEDDRPIVVMTCGIAGAQNHHHSLNATVLTSLGSGKTTLAKAIQSAYPAFTRLSGDEIIFELHGLYGIDYIASPELYDQYQEEKDNIFESRFRALLGEKQDVILEKSFYAREDRDEYRAIANEGGARVVLVYLKAEGEERKELLWKRICKRAEGVKTADSAFDITRETFEMYWEGFEEPVDEDQVVVIVGRGRPGVG